MAGLMPYQTSSGLMPSHRSPVGRELARSNGAALVRANQVDLEGRLTDLKLGAAAAIGNSAQQQVAQLTAMEAELTKAVPLAAPRLEMIGNFTTLGMAEIVTDALTKLRRL